MSRPGRGGGRHGPARGALVRFTVFAAVTGLLTLFIAAQITGTGFDDRYRLVGTFDDVTGLLEGDLVKVAGTQVGRVSGVRVKDGRAEVTVEVDEEVRLPSDSVMSIRWRNMIGQRMIYLEPGRSRAMLAPGARVTRTRSVVDLSEIVNGLGPLTRNLDPDQLNQLLNAFAKTLDGNSADINLLITNLDGLTQTFAARSRTISQMVKDYNTVSGVLARRDRQIAQSVDNLAKLTEFFAGNTRLLDDAVVQISGVTTNLNAVLGGNEEQLGRVVRSLSAFTATARINIKKLEKVVQQLPPAMRALFQTFNGGHFMRTTALCINVVQGPCPFPMTLPGQPANADPAPSDIKKLESMLRGGR
ncbi:MCE family protein [Actinomadura sp. HBU206391]|uniref:MCE family protein n=1 Tax=Actinomadura sp. HBU206391 TaxID=2731692 RepID=UPI00164EE19E|nr:MlaD family protein [Actinomadura sp. HBU206391]MBC6460075.1 MCE family protein [Actinomadura sp. HBU206391]